MIIAIWGASATAKTTIARRIARKLDVPLRSCGEEIRLAAKEANVPPHDAPDTLHRSVDNATQEWASRHSSEGAVLEGRFLDQVLADKPDVVLVHATCAQTIRIERWAGRSGGAFSEHDLAMIDKADDLFRLRMYGSAVKGAAQITLDTSLGEADHWTDELLDLIDRSGARGRD